MKDDAMDGSLEPDVEQAIESDATLVPAGPSQLMVAAALLEPEEIRALLEDFDLSSLLGDRKESVYEFDASPIGRCGRDSKLSPFAWLFPDNAGTGGPARNQQGHHLRARWGARKKARHSTRQAQGSLFGDHVG